MLAKPIPLFCFSKKEGGPLPMAMVGGTEAKLPLYSTLRIPNSAFADSQLAQQTLSYFDIYYKH